MEELFDLGQKSPERTDISLCIFPHLQEFLAVDLRRDTPRVLLLSAADVFGDSFFDILERGFSQELRGGTEHPFAHLIDLPLRVEEMVRETEMITILQRLGSEESDGDFPTVAVFVVSGAALSMSSIQIAEAFQAMLGEKADRSTVQECANLLERLIGEEHEVVKRIDRQELRESLEEESPIFLTLWERRN